LEREELIGRCHCPVANGEGASGGEDIKLTAAHKVRSYDSQV